MEDGIVKPFVCAVICGMSDAHKRKRRICARLVFLFNNSGLSVFWRYSHVFHKQKKPVMMHFDIAEKNKMHCVSAESIIQKRLQKAKKRAQTAP